MDKQNNEKLVEAFDHMSKVVIEALHKTEEALAPTAEKMLENAEHIVRDLYALSKDEARVVREALSRDLAKAHKTINEEGKELRDWLNFDMNQIEDRFLELVCKASDRTWLEFREFESANIHASIYKTGEICSAGTLSCNACGQTMQLKKSSHIPPCPKCHKTEFTRVIKH